MGTGRGAEATVISRPSVGHNGTLVTSPPGRIGALPEKNWTAIDWVQNFADAVVARAARRLSLESVENDNHDGDVYHSAVYYADTIASSRPRGDRAGRYKEKKNAAR